MMTTTQSTGLALAGLGLDKDMLLRVARILLADVYWDEDREGEYDGYERQLMERPETPQVPDELDAVMRLSHICGRIEQAWGESFYSIAERITSSVQIREEIQENLVYYALMACIGHGIGPCDVECFPEELSNAPIHIENPMYHQLDLLPESG